MPDRLTQKLGEAKYLRHLKCLASRHTTLQAIHRQGDARPSQSTPRQEADLRQSWTAASWGWLGSAKQRKTNIVVCAPSLIWSISLLVNSWVITTVLSINCCRQHVHACSCSTAARRKLPCQPRACQLGALLCCILRCPPVSRASSSAHARALQHTQRVSHPRTVPPAAPGSGTAACHVHTGRADLTARRMFCPCMHLHCGTPAQSCTRKHMTKEPIDFGAGCSNRVRMATAADTGGRMLLTTAGRNATTMQVTSRVLSRNFFILHGRSMSSFRAVSSTAAALKVAATLAAYRTASAGAGHNQGRAHTTSPPADHFNAIALHSEQHIHELLQLLVSPSACQQMSNCHAAFIIRLQRRQTQRCSSNRAENQDLSNRAGQLACTPDALGKATLAGIHALMDWSNTHAYCKSLSPAAADCQCTMQLHIKQCAGQSSARTAFNRVPGSPCCIVHSPPLPCCSSRHWGWGDTLPMTNSYWLPRLLLYSLTCIAPKRLGKCSCRDSWARNARKPSKSP